MSMESVFAERIESLEAELAEAHADNAALEERLKDTEMRLSIALAQLVIAKAEPGYPVSPLALAS